MNIFEKEKKYILQTYSRHPLAIKRAQGKYVWDYAGKRYLDFFSGLGVCNIGHCHRSIVNAIKDQSETLMHTSNLYYTMPQVKLAEKLSKASLKGKVFFSNSGAEANECAIKLARKNGKTNKWKIVTFINSFHGRTLATLAATGQKKFHRGFEPLPRGFVFARFNDLASVNQKMDASVCAVIVEPIQGEGGVHVAEPGFLKGLKELCMRKKILLIFDEVQCGLGRTGSLFAYQGYGVKPDILTLAKSLGGGLPIGATVTTPSVAKIFSRGDHGSTFGGNPVACQAGSMVMDLLKPSLLRQVTAHGDYLIKKLRALTSSSSKVKQIRGKGLMVGIELAVEGADIVNACRKKGLLINCTQKTVLRMLPFLDVTRRDIDTALDILAPYLR
ncbi:MAG: acetylornithine/succinylornithine family transaminase [Elusimicrobia bacterium]|nr:acetylornithine/succinylornithine family transaminase [Elusimicrobiota bacterium]MBD3411748.1 acetylornithine/succinylornithine family transaminase [Elusimicrobiota bacterium]